MDPDQNEKLIPGDILADGRPVSLNKIIDNPPIINISDFNQLPDEKKPLSAENTLGITASQTPPLDIPTPSVSENILKPESFSKEAEGYKPPAELISYLNNLVKDGRDNVRVLLFDIEDELSQEDVLEKLSRAFERGTIYKGEFAEMKTILGVPQSETHVEEMPGSQPISDVSSESEEKSEIETEPIVTMPQPVFAPHPPVDQTPTALSETELAEIQKEEMEKIDAELASARLEYSEQLTAWENENRKKKIGWQKLKSDLGFEKPMPETAKPPSLLQAGARYIEAKKQKSHSLFNQGKKFQDINQNSEILAQAEREYAEFQEKISKSLPPLEKNVIDKSSEKWAKAPLSARVTLSTALMTGLDLTFATVGPSATVAYGGYRVPKDLANDAASQDVAVENSGEDVSQNNVIKKEEEFKTHFDTEENPQKLLEHSKKLDTVEDLSKDEDTEDHIQESDVIKPSAEIPQSTDPAHSAPIENSAVTVQAPESSSAIEDAPHTNSSDMNSDNLFEYNGQHFTLSYINGTNHLVSDEVIDGKPDVEIAHETVSANNKVLTLDDVFQEGSQYAGIREAFNKMKESIRPDDFGTESTVYQIGFEKGSQISVVQGVGMDKNMVDIFLNGKEIANGTFSDKGLLTVNMIKTLTKAHWWQPETVYERALRHSISMLKTLRPAK